MTMAMPKENFTLAGQFFDRWMVLDDYILTSKKERKWLCRCDCGTERYVLERSLRNGGSHSCGCIARENARNAVSYDLLGKEFGDLKVVGRSKKRTKMGNYWTCLCNNCGYTCDATASELVTGKKTHCGCKTVKNYAYIDITHRRFNRLEALYPTKKRSKKGSVIWHCRCECGKELDVAYNDLLYCNLRSCGCKKKEHDELLHTLQTHVSGTSIEILQSKKIPTNNTTGYRGVYLIHGKYVAKIVFQKKQYFLGTYENIEDAAIARKNAEIVLFDSTIQFYERWKAIADADPEWAKSNPVDIQVVKEANGALAVHFLPNL